MQRLPLSSYQGELPYNIQRPQILPVGRVKPIQTPSSEQIQQRYNQLPAELRREVQLFKSQKNREILKVILDILTFNLSNQVDRQTYEQLNYLIQEYQRLGRQHNIKTTLSFDVEADNYHGRSVYNLQPQLNLQTDVVTDAFIYDLLRLLVAYSKTLELFVYLNAINRSLAENGSPFRILRYTNASRNQERLEILHI